MLGNVGCLTRGTTGCGYALLSALLAVGTLQASSPVAVRGGTPSALFTMGPLPSPGLTSLAVTWSQTSTYVAVSISAYLNSSDGAAAPGTAYLTNSLGPGATNVVPPAAFVVAGSQTTPTLTTLFTGLTLPPGAYYLTISNATSNNLGWAFVNGGATPQAGAGVTLDSPGQIDEQDNAAPGAYSPPASPTFVPALAGGSNYVLLFQVLGFPPGSVPAVSNGVLGGAIVLLLAAGLLLIGRRGGRLPGAVI